MSTAYYSVRYKQQETGSKYGFQAGASLKIPFENRLFFHPHIYYSAKGYTVTLTEPATPPSNLAVNNDTRFHTLEVVPALQYDLSKKPSHFFIRLAPAMDFALGGTETFDEISGRRVKRKMTFSFADYGYAAASFVLHAGYEHQSGWYLFAHYDRGVAGAVNADAGPTIRHRVAGISVGKYVKTFVPKKR